MCLARDEFCVSKAHAKALSLLKAQLEWWRNALPINSPGKRKTDAQVLREYLAGREASFLARGPSSGLPRASRDHCRL